MNNDTLWYKTPAKKWLEYLPVGNGHIGCMVSGDPFCNTLSLNDDTLWSGYPRDYHKADFSQQIQAVRRLLLNNERAQAEEIVETQLTNRFTQAYLPLGDLMIQSSKGILSGYSRSLDMASGIIHADYLKNTARIQNETYVSYPDDVLIHTIESDAPDAYEIRMTCVLKHAISYDGAGLTMMVAAPSDLIIGDVGNFYSDANRLTYDEPERGIRACVRAMLLTDGTVHALADHIEIIDARRISLVLCSATSFAKGEAYLAYCEETVRAVAKTDLDKIREAHTLDHAALYGRVRLDLGEEQADTSCEERLFRMRGGEANGSDISLLYQYGRYLLIASSRCGTQAANLQGIWNHDPIPPWWSGYTLNINLQMNYWLADRTNLSDCFEPLVSYTRRLCEAGKRTARENYGAEGSVAHHQSDLWAHSTPVGYDREQIPLAARWMMWNMPLPWLCLQLYDHYAYSKDEHFLSEELYPIMKSAADFIKSTFSRVDGRLCNVPSTSPENMYRDETGRALAICTMSAMDIGLSKEFALTYADVCTQLGKCEDAAFCENFSQEVKEYSVLKNGSLSEWDGEYEQTEPGHRHFSVLFGIYPGCTLIGSPFEPAARKALSLRLENGSGQTGWSAVWAALLLARLSEGNAAHDILQKLLRENIHENLFGAHPPELFQIDANFGFTAAVSELLIQEIGGIVRILPALPDAMPQGTLAGVQIHGGHIVSFGWRDCKIVWLEILAARDDVITLAIKDVSGEGEDAPTSGECNCISLRKGETYRLSCENETYFRT